MEVTEKIVGFIPQIDENVKTLFENYLKKPRNLSLAENSAFVNPFSEEISIYFEAENEAEAKKVIDDIFDMAEAELELKEEIEYACEAYFDLLVNPFYEKNPKYFQRHYNSIVKLLSLCVEMRNELDETVVLMCKAHNLRFVNPFSQKILVLS